MIISIPHRQTVDTQLFGTKEFVWTSENIPAPLFLFPAPCFVIVVIPSRDLLGQPSSL